MPAAPGDSYKYEDGCLCGITRTITCTCDHGKFFRPKGGSRTSVSDSRPRWHGYVNYWYVHTLELSTENLA